MAGKQFLRDFFEMGLGHVEDPAGAFHADVLSDHTAFYGEMSLTWLDRVLAACVALAPFPGAFNFDVSDDVASARHDTSNVRPASFWAPMDSGRLFQGF